MDGWIPIFSWYRTVPTVHNEIEQNLHSTHSCTGTFSNVCWFFDVFSNYFCTFLLKNNLLQEPESTQPHPIWQVPPRAVGGQVAVLWGDDEGRGGLSAHLLAASPHQVWARPSCPAHRPLAQSRYRHLYPQVLPLLWIRIRRIRTCTVSFPWIRIRIKSWAGSGIRNYGSNKNHWKQKII